MNKIQKIFILCFILLSIFIFSYLFISSIISSNKATDLLISNINSVDKPEEIIEKMSAENKTIDSNEMVSNNLINNETVITNLIETFDISTIDFLKSKGLFKSPVEIIYRTNFNDFEPLDIKEVLAIYLYLGYEIKPVSSQSGVWLFVMNLRPEHLPHLAEKTIILNEIHSNMIQKYKIKR